MPGYHTEEARGHGGRTAARHETRMQATRMRSEARGMILTMMASSLAKSGSPRSLGTWWYRARSKTSTRQSQHARIQLGAWCLAELQACKHAS